MFNIQLLPSHVDRFGETNSSILHYPQLVGQNPIKLENKNYEETTAYNKPLKVLRNRVCRTIQKLERPTSKSEIYAKMGVSWPWSSSSG